MKSLLSLLFLVSTVLLSLTKVSAWTQYQYFGHRLMNTVLRLREDRDQVDIERSRLESLFADRINEYNQGVDFYADLDIDLDLGRLLPLTDNLSSIKNLPVNDWMEANEEYYNDWGDAGTCFGEECDDDQCEIPAEFKQEPPRVDVLEFLGIARAEPLRVQKRL
mmetsp:Transcript_6421/g.7973  ORF Transcript_6421/g.7973 Transcript_6421/m.7973 type:complete len:164 (-) Transcript_6421:209-700(-)|eukprot:CAMPEP_0203636120 /NCGR_PEP_ID=MMETSP0088-20131115/2744_1 /ASSEMBLY_ACC=CAM_ASM_001087 /TAXON_ID=426623 /ORGANISM="Chaetoceros affinis, Strain CCMP159" /LENGTH=163 /DNA_ID=CAMNT_0050490177 /DNA_START=9 /DNA_END=500 /DNA_ORIENTATION=-